MLGSFSRLLASARGEFTFFAEGERVRVKVNVNVLRKILRILFILFRKERTKKSAVGGEGAL